MSILLLTAAGAMALALILLALAGPGIALLAVALAVASASPALAQTVTPTWGVWGAVAPAIDQGASWLVGAALSAIGAVFYALFRVALPAVLESRLRQTMLSGAHLLVLEAEEAAERAWTPERRRALVGQVVAYAMDRMPWAAARLKLTQRAVTGMAVKMLDQVLAGRSPVARCRPPVSRGCRFFCPPRRSARSAPRCRRRNQPHRPARPAAPPIPSG